MSLNLNMIETGISNWPSTFFESRPDFQKLISKLYAYVMEYFFGKEEEVSSTISSFIIQGNPSHGLGRTIPISIGDIRHLGPLSQGNFGNIFAIINQVTLTRNYPSGWSRANHDGTHSARQARMLQILLKKMDDSSSEEEKNALTLAAFLLRSGRVDETCHLSANPDDYYTRSAMIFEAYARQCVNNPEIVDGLTKVLNNSCKPFGIRETMIDETPKYLRWWNCLTIVHELDLIRCFSRHEMDTRIKKQVEKHLKDLGVDNSHEMMEDLFDQSIKLCEATGCRRMYDGHLGDSKKFALFTSDGEACWKQVTEMITHLA